nr:hypothetical protein Iba_chr04cCG18000 [Ipomoea batatas]
MAASRAPQGRPQSRPTQAQGDRTAGGVPFASSAEATKTRSNRAVTARLEREVSNSRERSWTTFGCRNAFTELRKCHPFPFVKSPTPQPDVTCTLTDLDLISAAKSTIPPSPAPLQRAETKFTSDCFSSFSSGSDFLALLLEYLNKDRNHAVLLWQFGAGFRRKEPERPSRGADGGAVGAENGETVLQANGAHSVSLSIRRVF